MNNTDNIIIIYIITGVVVTIAYLWVMKHRE
jgi:hypothetical protein